MSNQKPFDFDKEHPLDRLFGFTDDPTPTHKLYRKDGPDTSREAALSLVNISGMELAVYREIKEWGQDGCISDEVVANMPEYKYQTITARYKALMEKGWIEDTGERRKGISGRKQRVMRVIR